MLTLRGTETPKIRARRKIRSQTYQGSSELWSGSVLATKFLRSSVAEGRSQIDRLCARYLSCCVVPGTEEYIVVQLPRSSRGSHALTAGKVGLDLVLRIRFCVTILGDYLSSLIKAEEHKRSSIPRARGVY